MLLNAIRRFDVINYGQEIIYSLIQKKMSVIGILIYLDFEKDADVLELLYSGNE